MNSFSNSIQLFLENFIQQLEINNIPYKHTNNDLIILCPFCLNKDNKYKIKLYINKQNLIYHCFRCGAKDYEVVWHAPDKDGIIEFLCDEHQFSRERVLNAIERLEKAYQSTLRQHTLEAWFS